MREIDRYGRASLREQVGDFFGWFRTHRIVGAVLLVFAIGWLAQIASPPKPTGPNDLSVGDCLYARTSASMLIGPDARPIGEPGEVESVVVSGAAERAACSSSHGHEVSAVIRDVGSEGGRAAVQARCDAAFEDYVGRAPASSAFETFAVVPSAARWTAGEHTSVCLVARRDGQWMTSPARGSRG